ncbi:MAG: hypothetical protein A3H37_01765 [Candidatus Schekmanbacteria bacterium RIFCSPLOWO2_02_FULL_38_14]|uniref:Methylamine utilization protein MauG n=1 Tax=Candidatus Schekmanbacteria bacterium RIFCSPLOWO2_12_FULL_38_15 TaxID=1817883 RepID=A0A1F7SIN0_9BACT|nr:MAG: hypothetical protein A3H37_01765 [Candidatus Schekmanbacteria bacterium RIFCSPLOWO2_02_FULL_38_14]OGL53088.1 MAG: hypothetical protein A3G31_09320 [Candidatus Schekmanbacteria bacterium RIFCSPLOWO2_12_FULL_38_15]
MSCKKLSFALLFLIVLISSLNLSAQEKKDSPYDLKVSSGLIEPDIPQDSLLTISKVALGKKLYFDKRLSIDDTVSCATCHDPKLGFAENKKVSDGVKGGKGKRNAPSVLNAVFYDLQFWDGRAESLEEQAKGPIANPVEMGISHEALVEKLKKKEEYLKEFQDIFGNGITVDNIVKAIASYERTLISGNSPFDRYMYGNDKKALSDSAKRGIDVFKNKGRCITCHEFLESYASFTDNKFHNIGVGMDKPDPDLGRYEVTKSSKDKGAFKTPTLRNITLTAPYMHDGSEATLDDVIEFYNKGGINNPNLDGGMRQLDLAKEEKADLIEFLKSLTSEGIENLAK